MVEYMTTKEAALLWNISERRVSTLCKEGRLEGVKKEKHGWLIPIDTKKPADKRVKTGIYCKAVYPKDLPLPVGISDFRLAATEYYYIDKTLMIKDIIDERSSVHLFTRPRRFGKSLNMDMLRTFFEKTDEDTSVYFKDKKIWSCKEKYRSYQGKYPVLFITFKDVKFNSWEKAFDAIKEIFSKEAYRHKVLETSDKINDFYKKRFEKLLSGDISEAELSCALSDLSQMLYNHYGTAPVIIIDEYDTPIQHGYMKNYYEKVIRFMRKLLSEGFKDNKYLSFGFLAGVLCPAKGTVFSDFDNLTINSILDNKYSPYFGFTPDEIKKISEYYGASDKYDEIYEWYGGLKFGNTEIFNPYSVVNYFSNECSPRVFWQNTGNNDIIGKIIAEANEDIYKKLISLLNGKSFITYIDTEILYPQFRNDPSSVYSFLLVTGYLKVIKSSFSFSGDFMCETAIPNKEISFIYNKEILQKLKSIIPQSIAISIQEAVFSGDNNKLKSLIQTLLMRPVNSFDTSGKNIYLEFMICFCALLGNYYTISSRESKDGKYDIQMEPKNKNLPSILIELKSKRVILIKF